MSQQEAKQGGVFVALGSNLNSPERQVRRGVQALDELPETAVVACSDLYVTAPVGLLGEHPDFVNAVCEVRTRLDAHCLLEALHAMERRLGRMRGNVVGSRIIDLDLLLYHDIQIDDSTLCVPHPRMHQRAFVLRPLYEIAPTIIIPGRGPIGELLLAVNDQRIASCHVGQV